jgi:hypothetical protein
MEEDVFGTRKAVIGDLYDTCTRCGRPIPLGRAASPHQSGEGPPLISDAPVAGHPPEATLEAPPPRLCPECATEVAAGESLEWPSEPDDERTDADQADVD